MFIQLICSLLLYYSYFLLKLLLKLPLVKRVSNFRLFSSFDPDLFRSPTELIMAAGYTIEIHNVETEDGYILTAWRIGKNRENTDKNCAINGKGNKKENGIENAKENDKKGNCKKENRNYE
jgi:hypothetical protein